MGLAPLLHAVTHIRLTGTSWGTGHATLEPLAEENGRRGTSDRRITYECPRNRAVPGTLVRTSVSDVEADRAQLLASVRCDAVGPTAGIQTQLIWTSSVTPDRIVWA